MRKILIFQSEIEFDESYFQIKIERHVSFLVCLKGVARTQYNICKIKLMPIFIKWFSSIYSVRFVFIARLCVFNLLDNKTIQIVILLINRIENVCGYAKLGLSKIKWIKREFY